VLLQLVVALDDIENIVLAEKDLFFHVVRSSAVKPKAVIRFPHISNDSARDIVGTPKGVRKTTARSSYI
jgi:hypothetical protein